MVLRRELNYRLYLRNLESVGDNDEKFLNIVQDFINIKNLFFLRFSIFYCQIYFSSCFMNKLSAIFFEITILERKQREFISICIL